MTAGGELPHAARDHFDPELIPVFKIWSDSEEMATGGAAWFFNQLEKEVSGKKLVSVALSGGNSPKRFYEELGKLFSLHSGEWADHVEWFEGDERMVSPDHPRSNYRMMHQSFFSVAGIKQSHIHRIRGESLSTGEEALRYAHEITNVLASPGPHLPVIDYIFLGVGPDGHTASLFPGTSPELEHHQLVVVAPEAQEREARISMSYHLLSHARHIIFIVSGEEKKSVMEEILLGFHPAPVQELLVLRADRGETVTFWVDESAMSDKLKSVVSIIS